MKQKFIFVFILLTMLLMVNAIPYQLYKRTTNFGPCSKVKPPPSLLTVTLSPDPIVLGKNFTATISGTLGVDVPAVPESTFAEVALVDSEHVIIGDPIEIDLCTLKGIKCPIPAGTAFSTVFENVPVPTDLPIRAGLPREFEIWVDIFVAHGGMFLGCAISDPLPCP